MTPKRKTNEPLINWLQRIMLNDLKHGKLIEAFWMARFIINIQNQIKHEH